VDVTARDSTPQGSVGAPSALRRAGGTSAVVPNRHHLTSRTSSAEDGRRWRPPAGRCRLCRHRLDQTRAVLGRTAPGDSVRLRLRGRDHPQGSLWRIDSSACDCPSDEVSHAELVPDSPWSRAPPAARRV